MGWAAGGCEERTVMARDEDKRWKCTDCGAVVLETELLMATSPFYDGDVLHGCPKCFATDGTTTIEEVCDEPGCTEQATCGFPVADEAFGGYRRTCGKHWREHEDKTPNA